MEKLAEKFQLARSEQYKKIRSEQLEMIIAMARNNYDEKELKGMLKLIAKTDEWESDYTKKLSK